MNTVPADDLFTALLLLSHERHHDFAEAMEWMPSLFGMLVVAAYERKESAAKSIIGETTVWLQAVALHTPEQPLFVSVNVIRLMLKNAAEGIRYQILKGLAHVVRISFKKLLMLQHFASWH